MGNFDEGIETKYQIRKSGNGVYAFVLKGSYIIDGTELSERDGLGISDADAVDIKSGQAGSEILLMDIPMNI
jgi:redox-sensitive bicupin YhaK (pirin superfamily)